MKISNFVFYSSFIIFTITSAASRPSNPVPSPAQALPPSEVNDYPVMDAFLWNPKSDPQRTGQPLGCLFCTLLVNSIEDYTTNFDLYVDKFILNKYCDLFDKEMKKVCFSVIQTNGKALIAALSKSTNPDEVCREMKLCLNPQCNLFSSDLSPKLNFSKNRPDRPTREPKPFSFSALVDLDGDSFSATVGVNRGYFWTGRDCDEKDNAIYPGRKVGSFPNIDHDCNGISGTDTKSRKTYEESLCGKTKRLGVVVAGDSNSANDHIPERLFDISGWNGTPFSDLLVAVQESFMTPAASPFTGFCPEGEGTLQPCRSIYTYLYKRNKCNFRDYQNVAASGAGIKDTLSNVTRLARQSTLDHPVLMFLQLTINDICFPVMTTPEEFQTHLIEILDYIDSVLPSGSHLVIVGLIEDDIYERMAKQIHPSGVTYADFYEFRKCNQNLWCEDFLNPDATQRAARLERAHELNQAYKSVLSSYVAQNFDAEYYDFPKDYILDKLSEQGLDSSQLYNQMDGFHLNQVSQALLADYLWNALISDHPEWLGDPNPNNPRIEHLFRQVV